MFKFLIVMVPMVAGAALAGAVRAETLAAAPVGAAPAAQSVAASSADLAPDHDVVGADMAPAAHLPEPASWAMMMTGVGVVGAISRRRRALTLATAA